MRFTANALGRRTRSGRRSWAIYPILREAISGHSACGRRSISPVHWRKMGCRFKSGEWDSFRRNCRRDFWKPVRRFFYMVQMRKFITCRVNNRICLRKLFRSYPIRQMSRERSRCLCLNSRVQRKLQRPRYVRQQTGRLSLSRKRQRRCIDSPCSLQR